MNPLPVNKFSPQLDKQAGFTLLELMMTLIISVFIGGTVYMAYTGQHKSQIAQDDVIEIQQNLRAVINLIASEIRMAGYKPPKTTTAVGLADSTLSVNSSNLAYTWIDDASTQYEYQYTLVTPNGAEAGDLYRKDLLDATKDAVLAENIVAMEFYYTLADTSDNNIYDPVQTLNPTANEIDDIRAVTISVLARGSRTARDKLQGPSSYVTAGGTVIAANPDYRHRLLVSTVKLRNMGL